MNVRTNLLLALVAALLALPVGCGVDDNVVDDDPMCATGEQYDPILGDCVRLPPENSVPAEDTGYDEPDMADEVEPDLGPPDMGCMTDNDGDGAISAECGGNDCDDDDSRRRPDATELCDEIDNNCDGENNEGIECSVYAHSNEKLYRVDFFAGTYEEIGETPVSLWDIDTHPDGTLYGVANNKLYTFDPNTGAWTEKDGTLGDVESPNGFCIDNFGSAYMTSGITQQLLRVNLASGNASVIGSTSPASSSGDCVVNKGNVLFMTSGGVATEIDDLVKIDGDNASSMLIGPTGFDRIWALTAAYGRVFGMTAAGDVISINDRTGEATLIHTFEDISFYGAASSPER